ncbi:MAG TPA: ROK family transcriptional regulator [Micromonosporaceae bacterium]|nr:ROK family transcriptional regulator [Micromonosporaceae bacterium]
MRRTARDLRRGNRFEILRRLYRGVGVTRHEIAADTGLSFATVSNTVAELLELGILMEAGFRSSGGGRPRAVIAVNAARGALVGVDIAETYVQAEVFDLRLQTLGTVERALHPEENQPADVVAHVVAAVGAVLGDAGVDRADVVGVGVSLPGQVDPEAGVSIFAPNWNWHDVPVGMALAGPLGLPLHVDNPLKASTVAHLWFGAGRAADDLVVVTLGTGVGAGLAFGGSLYRGVTNSAGEWGHTSLILDGRLCRCGNRGCVEAYVGAAGIMQNLRDLVPGSALLHSDDQTATITDLAAAADRNDPVAVKVITETARYLGAGVADLVNVINPEVVVLGGWVAGLLGPHLLPEVRNVIARHALRRSGEAARLELCQIGRNAVSLGAATLALEGFLATVDAVNPRHTGRNAHASQHHRWPSTPAANRPT